MANDWDPNLNFFWNSYQTTMESLSLIFSVSVWVQFIFVMERRGDSEQTVPCGVRMATGGCSCFKVHRDLDLCFNGWGYRRSWHFHFGWWQNLDSFGWTFASCFTGLSLYSFIQPWFCTSFKDPCRIGFLQEAYFCRGFESSVAGGLPSIYHLIPKPVHSI